MLCFTHFVSTLIAEIGFKLSLFGLLYSLQLIRQTKYDLYLEDLVKSAFFHPKVLECLVLKHYKLCD